MTTAAENACPRRGKLEIRTPERWQSGRMRRFAKPLYGLTPVPRVRIPPSPPVLLFSASYMLVIPALSPWGILFPLPHKGAVYGRMARYRRLRRCLSGFRPGAVRNTQTSKILQPVKMKNGRLYVTLSSSGFKLKCTVHSLVASAFLGECPPNHEITHQDGDYTHNEVSNLEYVTRSREPEAVRHENRRILRKSHQACANRGWMRYCPVAQSPNGRVKPDLVVVNGQQDATPRARTIWNGAKAGRRIRLSVGKDASRRQPHDASGRKPNSTPSIAECPVLPEDGDGHRSVAKAVAAFLDETELTKKPKTLSAYTTALNYFTESCPKLYLQDIERATCSSSALSCVTRRNRHHAAARTSLRM